MKKKILSLALALVMCLSLTVPAFAIGSSEYTVAAATLGGAVWNTGYAGDEWKLEVPGKSNAEIFMGKRTFTIRDWTDSEGYDTWGQDKSGSEPENFSPLIREEPREYTAANVCVLTKGDTAVFTYKRDIRPEVGYSDEKMKPNADGTYAVQGYLYLMAWSDPDGDGVYEGRLMEPKIDDRGSVLYEELLPANVTESDFYIPSGKYDGYSCNTACALDGGLRDFVSSSRVSEDRYELFSDEKPYEIRLSADKLLERFGPNTLVIIGYDLYAISRGESTTGWTFFMGDGTSTQPAVPTVGGFNDVKQNDWFADAAVWAVENKIISGTSKTTFSPKQGCTLAEVLTYLWRANGSPKPTIDNPFTDVKNGDWYTDAAVWAYEKGIVSGTVFGGDTLCPRSMTVTYMWKAAGSPAASYDGKFGDVPASADYAQAVAWAASRGITIGTAPNTFSPDSICTRAQIVTFLYRAYN